MLNLEVDEIEKIIASSPKSSGRYNLFFKINDKIGLKLSLSEEIRDNNYRRQTEAAKIGCGPETYGTIDQVVYSHAVFYGYFTEIVQTYNQYMIPFHTLPYDEYLSVANERRAEITAIINKMKPFFNFTDCHNGNLGVKDGHVVCIDFDEFSPNSDCSEQPYEFSLNEYFESNYSE